MGKKHKKKVYNTPKKIKHTHKKVGVECFLNSFNNPKCDKCLSIMANHNDRLYCGKCNYSINHNSCMQQGMELHL